MVPRFYFGKLINREKSLIKEEILPFIKRSQKLRFLYSLNRSSRVFLAKNISRLKHTEWSY
jgi:hypothetical protein